MATTKAVVLLTLCCVALATAKPAADTPLDLVSAVQQQTAAAIKALAALDATCTRGSARSIQEAEIKVFGDLASCSVSGIVKNIAYIIIDAADFGSAAWADGSEIVSSIKACFHETTLPKKLDCLDDILTNPSDAMQDLNEALRQFVEKLIVIIEDIKDEIRTCQGKSTGEYEVLLNSLVEKAKTC